MYTFHITLKEVQFFIVFNLFDLLLPCSYAIYKIYVQITIPYEAKSKEERERYIQLNRVSKSNLERKECLLQ